MTTEIKKEFIMINDNMGYTYSVEKDTFLLEMLKSKRGGIRILREMPVKIIINDVVLRAAVEQAYNDGKNEVIITL